MLTSYTWHRYRLHGVSIFDKSALPHVNATLNFGSEWYPCSSRCQGNHFLSIRLRFSLPYQQVALFGKVLPAFNDMHSKNLKMNLKFELGCNT